MPVVSNALPSGMEMVFYQAPLSASGGLPPYQWELQPVVSAWGDHSSGQSLIPPGLEAATGLSAGLDHSAICLASGYVSILGTNANGGAVSCTAVDSGGQHILALGSRGTVCAWGDNTFGQCDVPAGLSNVVAVSAGMRHSAALVSDGTVRVWGDGTYGQVEAPEDLTNVTAISAGGFHTLALRADGTVVAWGYDGARQAGVPEGLSNVTAVAAGGMHSLALRSDGTVMGWGYNEYGQADVPAGFGPVRAIVAGGYHSLALFSNGVVRAWGNNWFGQTNVPDGVTGTVAIAAGEYHSLAMLDAVARVPSGLSCSTNGLVSGTPQRAGVNHVLVSVRDSTNGVARGVVTLAVEANPDTRPFFLMKEPADETVSVGEGVPYTLGVVAMDYQSFELLYQWLLDGVPIAVDESGFFEYRPSWGDAGLHVIGVTVSDGLWTNEAVAMWQVRVLADADADGMKDEWEVFYFGMRDRDGNGDYEGDGFSDLAEWLAGTNPTRFPVAINTGVLSNGTEMMGYSLSLSATNGSGPYAWTIGSNLIFRVWGAGGEDDLPVPGNVSVVSAVDAGAFHHLALRGNGTAAGWGHNGSGQAMASSLWIDLIALSGGGYHSLGLRTNGSVVAWGDNSLGQSCIPPELTGVKAISAGAYHSLALLSDGTVRAWGDNSEGQGVVPAGLSNVTAISAGGWHNLALKSDGTVRAWGFNGCGQTNVPPGLTGVTAIAAGFWHNLALLSNGTVTAWGLNEAGQTGVPAGLNEVIAIAAGGRHSLALRRDRTLIGWGDNRFGQSSIPAGLSNITTISAGMYTSLALHPYNAGLPEGLMCDANGVLTGVPTQAGAYHVAIEILDADGGRTSGMFEWVIQSNANTRPVITSLSPAGPDTTIGEASQRVFQVSAYDPEGVPLTYAWRWNGAMLDSVSNRVVRHTDWGDAGVYTLRCDVADGVWTNVVCGQWKVTVLSDNDGDGMANWQELDLLRNPYDAGDGGAGSSLSGTIRGRGSLLTNGFLELRGLSDWVYHRAVSSNAGSFVVSGIPPGRYFLKAGAPSFMDEWHSKKANVALADPCIITAGTTRDGYDFDLSFGQAPAMARVTSSPTGAAVYLDFQQTGLLTPAVLDLGEVGDRDSLGFPLARPIVSVRKDGYCLPPPVVAEGREAETALVHVVMVTNGCGSISVSTDPAGAEVYLDRLDERAGLTPFTADELAPGIHYLMVQKAGYQRLRAMEVAVGLGETNPVYLFLKPLSAGGGFGAEVRSVPPGAAISVDYLPTAFLTDSMIGGLDPVSNSGLSWKALMHSVSLRHEGYRRSAPRYVGAGTNDLWVHLMQETSVVVDQDHDGLPDMWEQAYGLWEWAPQEHGPDDDPDRDGVCNRLERGAGTDPLDPESVFGITGIEVITGSGDNPMTRLRFRSVPGRAYLVQDAPSPGSGWADTGGVFMATQDWTDRESGVPDPLSKRFYRIINLVP